MFDAFVDTNLATRLGSNRRLFHVEQLTSCHLVANPRQGLPTCGTRDACRRRTSSIGFAIEPNQLLEVEQAARRVLRVEVQWRSAQKACKCGSMVTPQARAQWAEIDLCRALGADEY